MSAEAVSDVGWSHGGVAGEIGAMQREVNEGRALRRQRAHEASLLAAARAEQARIAYSKTGRWRLIRRHRLAVEFMDMTVLATVLSGAAGGRFYGT